MDSPLAKALAASLPLYEIPTDDLIGEVIEPAMKASETVQIGAGFFSSFCLSQIAPGLAAYIHSESGPLNLMISPEISQDDRQAIEAGLKYPEQVVNESMNLIFQDAAASRSALVEHTLSCLSYLVASERIDIRFVLMRNGMYHKKFWLFSDGNNIAAVHGSGNATARGLLVNGEQMTVDRPWADGAVSGVRVEILFDQWTKQWENTHPHSLTITASQGIPFLNKVHPTVSAPTIDDFWTAWRSDNEAGLEPELPPGYLRAPNHQLSVPSGVVWREGTYAHQGKAVDRLLSSGGCGVLQIATGGGKTRTALIAATELQNQNNGAMLLVILVPSKPLLEQWAEDVREFGIEPALPSKRKRSARAEIFEEIQASLSMGIPRTEVIIASNNLFSTDRRIRDMVSDLSGDVKTVLIGDEMHNLGVATFLDDLPEDFEFRIGLSATPVRQYDPDGTDRLFGFFGQPVFEFSLSDAIESGCLTNYRYELHQVNLTDEEMEKYEDLTDELRMSGFRASDDGQTIIDNAKVERLLRERRSILENAGNKLHALRLLLSKNPRAIERTLVYASAKPKAVGEGRQLDEVMVLLSELGIISHRFTNAETSKSNSAEILERFAIGDYQVLAAMKVLDEGVDIPQTDTAFVLASSTVTREWVQRRGRILRRSSGKEVATLHDFLVVPPDPNTRYGQSVLRGELKRAEEFVSLSVNEWDTDGPRDLIGRFE